MRATPRLSIGNSDFAALREPGVLLVDKTGLIARILADPYQTVLFPRPRRFGKTTNLSMIGYFLGKGAKDHSALFQDLAIWRSAEARQHFQRHPLIYLTFKDIKERTWAECLANLTDLLTELYSRHRYLLEDPLRPEDATAFKAILDHQASPEQYKKALRKLTEHLHAHHGEKAVILIDEYDTPLHEAFRCGYYDEAVRFFRGLLSGSLKDNEHLFKGVLTGILRIAKESLFSDLNNLGVYSLLSPKFAMDFGFTEPEVQDLLRRLRSSWSMEELRRWYNGYDFGGQVIYNPWSVLSALGRPEEPLKPYWVNTASNDLIHELLLRFGGGGGEMEALLSGQGVRKIIWENIVLRDIYREPDALWSFLLFTGYLKAQDVQVDEEQTTAVLKVPNLEVGQVFRGLFSSWLRRGAGSDRSLADMGQALLSGDLERFGEHLSRVLLESVSFLDVGGKRVKMPPEHVYQVLILALLVFYSPRYVVKTEREGGHGRYDVVVLPKEAGLPGAVLELKVKKPGQTLERALAAAKKQLLEKDYAAELRAHGAAPIQQVAVAFDGKRVLVGSADDPAPPARRARSAARR